MSKLLFWQGPAYGRMNNASNWGSPAGPPSAPVPGDLAVIGNGPVLVIGEGTGVNVTLTGGSLDMIGGSIGSVAVNARQYSFGTRASGAISVTGTVTGTGGMQIGTANNAPDTLTINEFTNSMFVSQGTISVLGGSTLTEIDGAHTEFRNDAAIVTSGGSHITIRSDLSGTGTITDSAAAKGGGSLIEVGGSVGDGQSIALNSGTLQIDKPMQFHGVITSIGHTSPGASLNSGAIVLEHADATMALLIHDELLLWGPRNFIAALHINGASNSSPLYATHEPGGRLAITGYSLPGATALIPSPIPVHLP